MRVVVISREGHGVEVQVPSVLGADKGAQYDLRESDVCPWPSAAPIAGVVETLADPPPQTLEIDEFEGVTTISLIPAGDESQDDVRQRIEEALRVALDGQNLYFAEFNLHKSAPAADSDPDFHSDLLSALAEWQKKG